MATARPSETAELPLLGGAPRPALDELAVRLALEPGLDGPTARALVDRHGTEALDVVALGRDLDLVRRIGPDVDQLEAEVVWAARRELAASLDDVLARRMRLAQVLPDRGEAIAPRVAELLGGELGWDAARQGSEVARYLETARREYGVPWPRI
jgi:glycerol-3-phosphate dehydrogenase